MIERSVEDGRRHLDVNWFECGGNGAAVYHYVYHYSFALHLNHMIFLHSYLFGVILAFAAAPLPRVFVEQFGAEFSAWMFPAAFSTAYLAYSMLLNGIVRGGSYGCVIASILSGAVYFRNETLEHLDGGMCALIAVGFILASFACQLIGHAIHEKFKASPNLMHGFIAAPVLEWRMLFYRLGCYEIEFRELHRRVENVRCALDDM